MNSNDEKTQLIGRFIYILMNRVIALLNRHKFPKNICPYCGNVMISVVRTKNGESLRCPQCQGTFLRQYKPYLFIKRCSDHTNEMHCSYCGTKFESVWLNEKSEGYYCLHCKAYFSRPFETKLHRENNILNKAISIYKCPFCLERMYECRKEETSETYECFHCECFSFREIPFPIDGNELVLYDVTIGNAEVAVPYSIFRMFNQESNE